MHDLFHDLARSIMENKVPGERDDRVVLNSNKIRQVNLRQHYLAFPASVHLDMDISSVVMNFNRLRILDASRIDMEDLPSEIGNLKHLRYLNLSGSKFRILPSTICLLWNLIILNLNDCKWLVDLPRDMRYMSNLRHLFLNECTSLSKMPPNIGQLSSLKTLSLFVVGRGSGNQLRELECLNLGGKLEIQHLERVRNYKDAKKANLKDKSNLRELVLRWKCKKNAKEPREETDEKVLEALEPHPNLETLTVFGFKGRYFPPWTRMENITHIRIEDCSNCLRLPPLGDLPRLKFLKLSNLAALKYITENHHEVEIEDLNPVKFPSLEELELRSLPVLRRLMSNEEIREIFTNLQKIDIWDCPWLILPPLSSLKELSAWRCSRLNMNSFTRLENLTSLALELDNKTITYIPKEMLEKLSNLKTLNIRNANKLPIQGLRGLKSLTELYIVGCETITCLPNGWLRDLTTLETLDIFCCEALVELSEEIKYLYTLKHLRLGALPKMRRLPEVLQYIPSLRSLTLSFLHGLTSLPNWLDSFTSLEDLFIYECPMLTSLPESIQRMTHLRSLSIVWNIHPKLIKRCEKEKGEDWHKIAHIPNVSIIEKYG